MSKTQIKTPSVKHYLDGARGQYIPRDFARDTKRDCIQGVEAKDLDYLAQGPGGCLDDDQALREGESIRGEFYWDVWQEVLDNAILIEPDTGHRYRLHQDDSLFLIPEDWEFDEDSQAWRPPESDTLKRFELPAYWASYLINGDDSGISEEDKRECEAFIEREDLKEWTCADCSPESHFGRSDYAALAGDVSEYTFVLIK